MQRFLPSHIVSETVDKADYWVYLTHLVQEEATRAIVAVNG